MDRSTVSWMDGGSAGWMDRSTVGWMDGGSVGWMDECKYCWLNGWMDCTTLSITI